MLLGLGLLTFSMYGSPGSIDTRQSTHAARGDLRPLVGAATKPSGGGMIEGEGHAAGDGARSDAASAALSAQAGVKAATAKSASVAAKTVGGGRGASATPPANVTAAATNRTVR